MSRRKQSRPRSVKVIEDAEELDLHLGEAFDEDSNNNNNKDGQPSLAVVEKKGNESQDGSINSNIAVASRSDSLGVGNGGSKPQSGGSTEESRAEGRRDWARATSNESDVNPLSFGSQYSTSSAKIPPNFLLPLSTSASSIPSPTSAPPPVFSPPYLPPPPHLIPNPLQTPLSPPLPSPSSSRLPSLSATLPPPPSPWTGPSSSVAWEQEMARRKRSPKSLSSPWRVRVGDVLKLPRCMMCPKIAERAPVPVEGHEYFIDSDGTLTIKNGVCPRSLALMLFSEVSANRSRYELLLGENLVKFLLNLKQIVEKHQFSCPAETPVQVANAQNILKEYNCVSAPYFLSSAPSSPSHAPGNFSTTKMNRVPHDSGDNSRKRPHKNDRDEDIGPTQAVFFRKREEGIGNDNLHPLESSKEMMPARVPDNFLEDPLPTPSPSPSHSPVPRHQVSLPKSSLLYPESTSRGTGGKRGQLDALQSLTPSGSEERDARNGMASDIGSVGGASSSRVTSPAPSVSSIASSNMGLADAAKQMANTKRGSKILPVAGADGGTRYLCPVCALELPTDHALTVHIRSHNSPAGTQGGQAGPPNSCTICGKTLSSQSSLDRHMLVHSGERPFRCKICDMSFTTNGNMHRHARIHEKNGTATPKPPGRKPSSASSSSSASVKNGSAGASASKSSRSKKDGGLTPSRHAGDGGRETLAAGSASSSKQGTPQHPSLTFPGMMTEFGGEKLDLLKAQNQASQSSLLQYYNDMSLRMGSFMFPFSSHHPAFPYQHLLTDPSRMPYLPHVLDPRTGEVLAKQARLSAPSSPSHSVAHVHRAMMAAAAASGQTPLAPLSHLVRESEREPSPDLRAQQQFACNVCSRIFSSQWSLEAHMESHVVVDERLEAESGCAVCKICKTVAKSEESLLLHTLTHHREEEALAEVDSKSPPNSPSPPSPSSKSSPSATTSQSHKANSNDNEGSKGSNSSSKSNGNNGGDNGNHESGFQNLNFTSFSIKKFPLIAKAFCEAQCAHGQKAPIYPCEQCGCEFPVEGARELHEVSHLPEEYTSCPKCQTHFSSSTQLQRHMLKHVADLRFAEICTSADDTQIDSMSVGQGLSQAHFLAQLGLVTKDVGFLSSEIKQEKQAEEDKSTDSHEIKGEECSNTPLKLIKQEIVDKPEEEESNDGFPDQDETLPKLSPLSPKSLSSEKSLSAKPTESTAPLLKISPSLFGSTQVAVKAAGSRVSSPLSLEDGESLPQEYQRSSSPSSQMFPCKHCDAVFPSHKALKHHQRSQHESAQFRCQVCSYTSTDKSTLLRHMRTHSGERPYKCAVCDYSFTTKANCERHLRQKHGLEKEQISGKIRCNEYIIASLSPAGKDVDTSATPPSTLLSSVKAPSSSHLSSSPTPSTLPTQCPSCQVDFLSFAGLQQHLLASPACGLGYLCLKCKMPFKSRKGLISHMSSQHPDLLTHEYDQYTANLRSVLCGIDEGSSTPPLLAPPPAHAHSKASTAVFESVQASPPASVASQDQQQKQQRQMAMTLLKLLPPSALSNVDSSRMASLLSQSMTLPTIPIADEASSDQPLDFSKTGQTSSGDSFVVKRKKSNKRKLAAFAGGVHSSTSSDNDDDCNDDDDGDDVLMDSKDNEEGPIDLSVPKPQQQQAATHESVPSIISGLKAVPLVPSAAVPMSLHSNKVEELYGVALRVLLAKTLRHP